MTVLDAMTPVSTEGQTPFSQTVPEFVDSLKVMIEPFEDRLHSFLCPLPIHIEVYAVF